jgi:hypothetical protein
VANGLGWAPPAATRGAQEKSIEEATRGIAARISEKEAASEAISQTLYMKMQAAEASSS